MEAEEETKEEDANKKRTEKGKNKKVLKVLSTPHKHKSERTIDMALV